MSANNLINHPDLQRFAKQLATWTESIIENGRTPFRRVDLYPRIQTEQGVLQPPLIFWINRQSMMAGGILLLPERNLTLELERGRSCAEALGLRHFVTWETDRIRTWQLDGTETNQHQEFLFGDVDHPDCFRQQLEKLLETLKLLAVIGLIPANQLSAHYLHNLFLTTLELSLPPLLNSYRSQRAQDLETTSEDAERQATEANRQLLLQLLALLWHQQLPSAILPEKLERAIEICLPQLPEALQRGLTWKIAEQPASMPHETTVCFHHLLLRLRQLAWDQSKPRALTTLQLVIDDWFPPQPLNCSAQICCYPPGPQLSTATGVLLSDSPSLLAAASLLEHLLEQPVRQQHFGNLLQFTPDTLPAGTIQAALTDIRIPGRGERSQYAAMLRTSWPNRRFKLATNTPLWLWETVHLLGLYRGKEVLSLILPGRTLLLAVDEPFWPLLLENYKIISLDWREKQTLALKLVRATNRDQPITINTASGQQQLTPAEGFQLLRSQLLLALQLPVSVYQMCAEQLIPTGEESLSAAALAGLHIYSHSTLGRQLWQLLGNAPLPLTAAERLAQAKEIGWPHPESGILEELAKAETAEQNQHNHSDKLLAERLQCPDILEMALPVAGKKKPLPTRETLPAKLLKEQLIQQLQAEGLPTFPEKYLYFLEQPQMVRYRFAPPLSRRNEFLGQCELVDAGGQILQIYGEDLAQALLLCSYLEKNEVELPADGQQVALLLSQYRQDLKAFHQHLNELCFQQIEDAKAARKLAKSTWSKLALPPLKWLESQP